MTTQELRELANKRLAEPIEERPAGLTDAILQAVLHKLDRMEEQYESLTKGNNHG